MRRHSVFIAALGVGVLLALGLLLQTPGSLGEALSQPFHVLLGTRDQLNSTLIDVSETAEPVRAAGRRLLKPFGAVRLVRVYNPGDAESAKKR
jgi:hypothetical protein